MTEEFNNIAQIAGVVANELRAAQHAESAPPTAAEAAADCRLVVAGRIVALADVAKRLDGVRELVAVPGAIITPLVRDELRQRNIKLVFAAQAPVRAAGSLRVALVTAGTRFAADSLVTALRGRSIAVEPRAMDCLLSAVDWLAEQLVAPDVLGVLLTRFAAPAICLANRLPGIRAIRGSDVAGVAIDAAAVGANLLVADADACAFYRLKQLVAEFCRHGVQSCPGVFAERLGRCAEVKP